MKRLSGSLFAKIFLWFWLLLVLVSIANILVFFFRDAGKIREERLTRDMESLRVFAIAAMGLDADGKREETETLIREYAGRPGVEIFLVDRGGIPLAGSPIPPAAADAVTAAWMGSPPRVFEAKDGLWLVARVDGPRGASVVAAQKIHKRNALPPPFHPRVLWQRFVVAIVFSGLLAWLLARSLSLPITRLKMSTRRLAEGDLEVRASSSITARGDEIGDLAREFDLMAARTQDLLSSRDRMLRDISHELRSPLARMGVALELAGRKPAPGFEASLIRIRREAERLNDLIGQLLTLSSMQGGVETPGKEPVDLAEVVQEIVRDADFEAKRRNREVRSGRVDAVTLSGRREMIRQAVENVVRNAARHTKEGTIVEVSVEKREGTDGAAALIRVRDHGPGVPEELLTSIFEPFFRVAEARERETGGIGIGLAITQRVIHVHGGAVRAFNAPDGGLVVEIKFPV